MFHYSPSGAALRKIEQIKDYLLSDGTCKCGLPCPFRPEHFFEFNPQVSEWQKSLNRSIPPKKLRSLLSTIETCWISTGMIVCTYPIITHSLIFEWGIPKLNGFTTIWWVWNLINSIIVLEHMFPVSWYFDLISVFEFSFSFGSSINRWTFSVNVQQQKHSLKLCWIEEYTYMYTSTLFRIMEWVILKTPVD